PDGRSHWWRRSSSSSKGSTRTTPTTREPPTSWSRSTPSPAPATSASCAPKETSHEHPQAPVRLADRRGDFADRHPDLDDRPAVVRPDNDRKRDQDRPGGAGRARPAGVAQGAG